MEIPLFQHNIGDDEIRAMQKVLNGNWHTAGPINQEVENLISRKFTNGKKIHVALTNSCSTAMMAASRYLLKKKGEIGALNIGPTRKILTTPMTFVATAASFMHAGAHPWFIDIDPETGLMDLDLLEAELEKRPHEFVGIWVVHLYGHPIDVTRLRSIADEYNLALLEDAAHGFNTTWHPYQRPGQLSDAACFSFYATKEIHCLPGYTKILVDYGSGPRLESIDSLGINCNVASHTANGKIQWLPVKAKHSHSNKKKCLRISTRCNRSIDCSDDHQLFIYENSTIKPVKASEVKLGEFLVVPKSIPTVVRNHTYDLGELETTEVVEDYVQTKRKLAVRPNNFPQKTLPRQQELDEDLAKLLGFYTAEGSISGTRIRWSFEKDEIHIHEVVKLWERRFPGWCANNLPDPNRNIELVSAGGKFFVEWFRKLGVLGLAHTKRIPVDIFSSSNEVKIAYIDGYWKGDGNTHSVGGKTYIEFKTVSQDLASDLHYLILTLGYPSTIEVASEEQTKQFPTQVSNCRKSYRVRVGDTEFINLLTGQSLKPRGGILEHRVPTNKIHPQIAAEHENKIRKRIKQKKSIGSRFLNSWEAETDFAFLEVMETQEINYSGVWYDLEVPGGHSFVAGDSAILVHNCGEGGAVISTDPELIQFVKQLTHHGLTKTANQSKLGNMGYDVEMLGWKGNLCDILASLLPFQIEMSDYRAAIRNSLADYFYKKLGPHVSPIWPKNGGSSWYTFPILCENRDKVKASLMKHKVGHTIMYEALHNLKAFQGYNFCPKAEEFSKRQLSLPCFSSMSMDQINRVIEAVNAAA